MPAVRLSPKSKLGPPPLQTARVQQLADEGRANDDRNFDVEPRILERIKKCLSRANHPNTPELEAKAALHMSKRLMAQYNVTQAEVLEKTTDDNDYAALGGQSTVEITSTKGRQARVIFQTWVSKLVSAIKMFFNCKAYSTRRRRLASIEWTFYGIAANIQQQWLSKWHTT
jgi:hypothetical protein